jgi:hypothetical protein
MYSIQPSCRRDLLGDTSTHTTERYARTQHRGIDVVIGALA